MTLTLQFCKCFVTWCVGRHTEPGKCQGGVFLELGASSGPIKNLPDHRHVSPTC